MKILVIEDEHRVATYIKKGLEIKSYVVDVAYDGEQGYDLASSEHYDIIILDRMLPKLSGIEITKNLRNDANHTPILMLTAKAEVEDRIEGLDAGADDYLGKPFSFNELLARIKAISRRPKQTVNDTLTISDLQLNTQNYTVYRAGQIIDLSKKEFALLEFLMRNQGKVFTKDQLLEQVWTYDSDALANTAQVYIGYLRNKIDRPFPDKPELIKTIRGFGYKIDVVRG